MADEDKNKIIYPELSYEIVGVLFDVFNDLGYGLQEKYYYRAIEQVKAYLYTSGLKLAILANFTEQGIKFKRILNIK